MNEYDLLTARELYALYWRASRVNSSEFVKISKALNRRHRFGYLDGAVPAKRMSITALRRREGRIARAKEAVRHARKYRKLYPRPLP